LDFEETDERWTLNLCSLKSGPIDHVGRIGGRHPGSMLISSGLTHEGNDTGVAVVYALHSV
jgi:hypothetical protein